MHFGVAKDIITPIKPTRLACSGGDFSNPYTSIHDDVYVRTLILESDGSKLIFMTFDLLFHDRSLQEALEVYAQTTYGVKPEQLLLTYTHAHTAPAAKGYNPGSEDPVYEAFLLDRAKSCLDRAMATLMPGTLEWGSFDANYNISRRGRRNGVFTNAPDFDYAHDTEFLLLCVRDLQQNVRSVLMNYACHPVFYPGKRILSGEFPARLCQYLDTAYYGCVSLFCQSAGGDVRPYPTAVPSDDPQTFVFRPLDFAAIDTFAATISRDVTEWINQNRCQPLNLTGNLLCHSFTIDLPLDPCPPEHFQEQADFYRDRPDEPNKTNALRIANGGYEKLSESLVLHCQIIRLTPTFYIAAMGGEPCYGVKKAVLSAFGNRNVLFVGYTDACDYLVDDVVLEEGGYEPTCYLEYGLIGPLKPGVTKKYTDHFAAALSEMHTKETTPSNS